MRQRFTQLLKRTVLVLVLYGMTLLALWALGYIDGDVVLRVYLPLALVSLVLLCVRQNWAAYGLTLGACGGLIVEYLHHLSRMDRPNMLGGMMNLVIVLVCGGMGIGLQILVNRYKKRTESKKTA